MDLVHYGVAALRAGNHGSADGDGATDGEGDQAEAKGCADDAHWIVPLVLGVVWDLAGKLNSPTHS